MLAALVPKGGKYGYDLIAHVGTQTFLEGRGLQAVAAELRPLGIPFSSLHDMLMKFLYYFGLLHRTTPHPVLRDWFRQRGRMTVADGCHDRTRYSCVFWPSGSRKTASVCKHGRSPAKTPTSRSLAFIRPASGSELPSEVLHDLGDAMTVACETVWGKERCGTACASSICSADIGEDLYGGPQATLTELVRKLKLHPRLKEQRRGQTDWLREHIDDTTALVQLLRGQAADVPPTCSAVNSPWPFISGSWTTPATVAARATPSTRTCCTSIAAWCGRPGRWSGC